METETAEAANFWSVALFSCNLLKLQFLARGLSGSSIGLFKAVATLLLICRPTCLYKSVTY